MTVRDIEVSRSRHPRRLGWGVGLLLMFVTIQVGVVLPAVVVFLLGGSSGMAATAMTGGFWVAWMTLIATLRVGQRRGWWA